MKMGEGRIQNGATKGPGSEGTGIEIEMYFSSASLLRWLVTRTSLPLEGEYQPFSEDIAALYLSNQL